MSIEVKGCQFVIPYPNKDRNAHLYMYTVKGVYEICRHYTAEQYRVTDCGVEAPAIIEINIFTGRNFTLTSHKYKDCKDRIERFGDITYMTA